MHIDLATQYLKQLCMMGMYMYNVICLLSNSQIGHEPEGCILAKPQIQDQCKVKTTLLYMT